LNKNKEIKSKNFLLPILSLVILSIISITFISTYLNISMFIKHMDKQIEQTKKTYLEKQKNTIHKNVHSINDSIKFQITTIEDKLKKVLADKINIALKVTQHIYDTHKDQYNTKELKDKIIQYLGAMQFNNDRGYYFIHDLKTNKIIGHPLKKYINKDMTNFKDKRGVNVNKLMLNSMSDSIGYYTSYFNKADDPNKEYSKLSAITVFKPLNIIIGTGEYLDIVENSIKKIVIKRFENSKKAEKNYLYFYDLHNINGGDNFATRLLNSENPGLVGTQLSDKHKDIKDKYFIKDLLSDLRKDGESYIRYWYKVKNKDKYQEKMSYFLLQKDWNWIIGSGFDFDRLNKQIEKMEESTHLYISDSIYNSIVWSIFLSFIVMIIASYVSIRIDKTIKEYTIEIVNYKENQRVQDKFILEQSKMVQMGEMIGNIAHQWRQPLSVISTAASGILVSKEFNTLTPEKEEQMLNGIIEHTQYLSKTIDTFRDYIKEDKILKEVILQDRINSAINILESSLKNNHIKLISTINNIEDIKITMVVGELSEVIINLINNAKDVLVENNIDDKIVKINLTKIENNVIITIEDNGEGVPENIIDKIFNPYFTTKHKSQGTGLGLHMSKEIIEKHLDGKLYVKNTDIGAKFFIELPLS